MGRMTVEYLTDLEAALRSDADMTRRQGGATVRLNLDDAADVCVELRRMKGQGR